VSSLTYGLIVEGPYDVAVFEELLRKITPTPGSVVPRPAGGVSKLLRLLVGLLRDLEHSVNRGPADKVLVIRDANGKDAAQLEKDLADRIHGQHFAFARGIQFHAVRRTVETLLLADAAAINEVATTRGGRPISEVHGELEEIGDPKDRLVCLLSAAALPFDQAVCREIAARTRLEVLRYRCPSFRSFEQKVVDC
jgi:hypothetical protein